jgi:hypothetical protein
VRLDDGVAETQPPQRLNWKRSARNYVSERSARIGRRDHFRPKQGADEPLERGKRLLAGLERGHRFLHPIQRRQFHHYFLMQSAIRRGPSRSTAALAV